MKGRYVSFILLLLFLCTACNEVSDPESVAKEIENAYKEMNYDHFYTYLKQQDSGVDSEESFIQWFHDVDESVQILSRNLELTQIEEEETEENQVYYEANVEIETVLGTLSNRFRVSFQQIEQNEENNWKMSWDTAFVLPQIENGESAVLRVEHPKRGEIFDRNQHPLAINGELLEVAIVPERMEGKETEQIEFLADLISVSKEYIEEKLNQEWVKRDPTQIVPIKAMKKDPALMEALEGSRDSGPTYRLIEGREYPLAEKAAHLTGYIGPITEEELNENDGYTASSYIGKTGLEYLYEGRLKGEPGGSIIIIGQDGTEKGILIEENPLDGEDMVISIDHELQRAAFQQLEGESGTNVMMDPSNGQILALVNAPAYDPNDFIVGFTGDEYKKLEENEGRPLLNRFSQTFVPGSTTKPIIAAIALENGWDYLEKINVPENNRWQLNESWGNHYITRVSGIPLTSLNLNEAMMYSDNIYFAKMALEIGSSSLIEGLNDFGFNDTLAFDYPLRKSTISSDEELTEVLLADTGYGQGELLVNPIHLAAMFTVFIHEGAMVNPTFSLDDEDHTYYNETIISPETAETVWQSLKEVIENSNGTGHNARIDGIGLAGKTGTAEHKSSQEESGKETGWFIAMSDSNPSVINLMMIEGIEDKGGSQYVVNKVRNLLLEIE
ncbi:peptidoglycan D,D-transpeptidase FtsI family protein [Alkalihalobacillus trypoxylicola]|uniref:serine-type D-Ala-D-Ala carboxypeptidase n=1 Tax=Alkalihalobacillus trypoxylicola TaxID=519424 RepID=A0A162CM52_9BACI|nr:penicillin-binding protein 2 [Alkalihalobacillus trypoxylicola]KYG25540.1 hypothetical protein AZF04_13700 [Alkalihalobacillus trypoxylicola]